EGYQQINGESSKTDNSVMTQECDNSSGHLQFYSDDHQQNNYGDNRTVDQKQRREDHREAHQRHDGERPGATPSRIRSDRRRTGDIDLDARRCRRARHDVADRVERLVPDRLARLTGEVQLDVHSLAVGALRRAGREWIPPEVVDVLNVLRVFAELA